MRCYPLSTGTYWLNILGDLNFRPHVMCAMQFALFSSTQRLFANSIFVSPDDLEVSETEMLVYNHIGSDKSDLTNGTFTAVSLVVSQKLHWTNAEKQTSRSRYLQYEVASALDQGTREFKSDWLKKKRYSSLIRRRDEELRRMWRFTRKERKV